MRSENISKKKECDTVHFSKRSMTECDPFFDDRIMADFKRLIGPFKYPVSLRDLVAEPSLDGEGFD